MSTLKEEKEKIRFENDPKYREKVIAKVHKEQDALYNKRIKQAENERDSLVVARTQEINRIVNDRWENIANGKLMVNRTEGKIRISNSESLFSSIRGASVNMQPGVRVVTTEQSKSKKHTSIGGAIVGGALLGPVGAVAGGVGLGKTKTHGTASSNQIQTCLHLGVMVDIDGFVSEVVLISGQVDQSSKEFLNAQSQAQKIISLLGSLSKTPVPSSFICMKIIYEVPSVEKEIAANVDLTIPNKFNQIVYHEAGHTVIHEILFPYSINLVCVNTFDSGKGGFTHVNNCNEYNDYKSVQGDIITSLGGTAALDQVYGIADTGNSRDLRAAFGETLNLISDNCVDGFSLYLSGFKNSNIQTYKAENAASLEIERYYRKAKEILAKNREFLDKLAFEIATKDYLLESDIQRIKATCTITNVAV